MTPPDRRARDRGAGTLFGVFDRGLAVLTAAGLMIGALVVIALTVIVGYSVALRYLWNWPQVWSDELVGYLLVYLVMLGAAEALRQGHHIEVDLVTERLGPRGRRIVHAWGLCATAFVALVLTVAGWEMVSFSADVGLLSEGYLEVPMWVPQSAVPLGSALLFLTAVSRLLGLLRGRPEPGG